MSDMIEDIQRCFYNIATWRPFNICYLQKPATCPHKAVQTPSDSGNEEKSMCSSYTGYCAYRSCKDYAQMAEMQGWIDVLKKKFPNFIYENWFDEIIVSNIGERMEEFLEYQNGLYKDIIDKGGDLPSIMTLKDKRA